MSKFIKFGNIIVIFIAVAVGIYLFITPPIAVRLWGESYKTLMFNCDQSMREHYIAKKTVEHNTNQDSIRLLHATEVGLLDCHSYDKLRKKMQLWGVSEHKLSSLGLQALEEKSYELRKFVEIHEFRY